MKHLLNGVAAVAAALVIAAPAWAQNPSGGNAVGTPGPNPGGPGLTPYSGGAAGAPAAPEAAPMAPSAMPPSASAPNSAMPPTHRQVMRVHHYHHVYHHVRVIHHGPRAPGDTTAELNRAELARIQSNNTAAPPAPEGAPGPGPMPPQSVGRMPGPKPSSSGYIPPSQPPQQP
jgi:hypothetical protein